MIKQESYTEGEQLRELRATTAFYHLGGGEGEGWKEEVAQTSERS
jgi:hypothetical protein